MINLKDLGLQTRTDGKKKNPSNQEPAAKHLINQFQKVTIADTYFYEYSCYLGSELKSLYLVGFFFFLVSKLSFLNTLNINSRLHSNHFFNNITATLQITFLVAWVGGIR